MDVSSADLDGNGSPREKRDRSSDVYSESGALVKNIWYDYRGNPFNVSVYGYLSGKRVSKRGECGFVLRVGLAAAAADR